MNPHNRIYQNLPSNTAIFKEETMEEWRKNEEIRIRKAEEALRDIYRLFGANATGIAITNISGKIYPGTRRGGYS